VSSVSRVGAGSKKTAAFVVAASVCDVILLGCGVAVLVVIVAGVEYGAWT